MSKKFVCARIHVDWINVSKEVQNNTNVLYLPAYLRNVWCGIIKSDKAKRAIEKIIGSEYIEVKTVVELANK